MYFPLLRPTLSLLVPLLGLRAAAAESFPPEGWQPEFPLPSPLAEPGGKFSEYLMQYPKSFNYMIENNIGTREIFKMMFETLLGTDELDYSNHPGLAERWEISADKKQFTFHLDPDAKWSDGKPVTADDAIWTFNALKDPKHLTGPWQAMYKRLTKCEKLDERTIRISADEVHWKNFTYAAGLYVLPKHWWEKQEFNKVNFEFPVVSGMYAISEVKEPSYVRLKRRPDYWNADNAVWEGFANFDQLEFRFYSQRDNAFEAFKKGEFDLFAVYTSSRWVKETTGERFEKNWIAKQSVYNNQPVGFQGFAMNMRRDLFKDRRVRYALGHLVDRARMNNDIMFNQYKLSNSYFPDIYDEAHPNRNGQVEFDVEKARALLKEAGWAVDPKDGKLKKGGEPFVLKFLTRDPSTTKFLLIFDEALKDVGITLDIDQKDWAGWARDMDEYNFDITWAPWGAIPKPFKDPETMWHTRHKDVKSGNNITGFSNPEVDRLIDESKTEFDMEKRIANLREIDRMLVEEMPYILLWNIDYTRLLYWNKFGTPDHVLGSFHEEWGAKFYWWSDPDQAADLAAARKSGDPLPAPPKAVRFSEVFTTPAAAEALR